MAFEYNNYYFNSNNREICLTMQIVPGSIVEGLVDTTYEEDNTMRCFINRSMSLVNIREIKKVKNSFLEAMYILKKKEYECRYPVVREEILIHVTGKSNVEPIIRNNFDWRKTKRGRFGYGTSFSGDAEYANKYANNKYGPERAFIVTKVLVSKTISPKRLGLKIPAGNVDTTTGNRSKVYVKYCDHEVLPLFVIYFNTISSDPRSHIYQNIYQNSYTSQLPITSQRPYSSQSNHISQRPSTSQRSYNNQIHTSQHSLSNQHSVWNQHTISSQHSLSNHHSVWNQRTISSQHSRQMSVTRNDDSWCTIL